MSGEHLSLTLAGLFRWQPVELQGMQGSIRQRQPVRQAAAKKFLNSPKTAVVESLEGLVAATPYLERLDGFPGVSMIVRQSRNDNIVNAHMLCLHPSPSLGIPYADQGCLRWPGALR